MDDFPWLYELYRKLLIVDMYFQLPGVPTEAVPGQQISETESRKLMLAASALSISADKNHKVMAYEIASRLLEVMQDNSASLVASSDLIFSNLGNFPGREFLRSSYGSVAEIAPSVPQHLALERLAREFENTVDLGDGREECLTDFQFNLFDALGRSASFSVSAPTSAGKSFVMGLDLIRRIQQRQEAVVYLVPTRALIREVSNTIRRQLREAGHLDVHVRTVPFPISKESAPSGIVYVLTQERLISLLAVADEGLWITTLIVDEAHNIQDGARGVVLQTAIERVSARFSSAEIHFASPLSANPGFLLELIGKPAAGNTLIETQSPVSQNLILVSQIVGKTNHARFSLLVDKEEIPLGTRDLLFSFRGNLCAQKAALARSITSDDEATIIFANDPGTAEDIAMELCRDQSRLPVTSQPIEGAD